MVDQRKELDEFLSNLSINEDKINTIISKKLKNQNIHNQEKIDYILIKLDGTKQKKKFGANSLLAVSMAVKKLSARIRKIPLYETFLVKKNFLLRKNFKPY